MVYRRFNKKTGRFKKRWYVNAGLNLPFIGNTKISMGNSKTKRSIAAVANTVVKMNKPKHMMERQIKLASGTQALHNTPYCYNITNDIYKGDEIHTRTSDNIFLRYLKANLILSCNFATLPTGRQSAKFRVLVIGTNYYAGYGTETSLPDLQTPINWSYGQPQSNLIFLDSQRDVPHIANVDLRKTQRVYYDKLFSINSASGSSSGINTKELKLHIPINHKVHYKSIYYSGDLTGRYQNEAKEQNIYLIIIPYAEGHTIADPVFYQMDAFTVTGFQTE